jgi:hypothetical protein
MSRRRYRTIIDEIMKDRKNSWMKSPRELKVIKLKVPAGKGQVYKVTNRTFFPWGKLF